jgi:predicted nucleic acid-binding Zn ribbon protein
MILNGNRSTVEVNYPMPVYTYRREDGTTFEVRQSFKDDALTVDSETGQKVVRLVQSAGIVFKGSGFYVNDSKNASKSTLSGSSHKDKDGSASTSDSTGSNASTSEASTSSDSSSSTEKKSQVKELSPIPQPPAGD